MATNFDKFRVEFNNLLETMQQKSKKTEFKKRSAEFDSVRQHLYKFNETVKYYNTDLIFINRLRNILIHEEKSIDYVLADPSIEIIDRIISIRKKISNPDDASIFCRDKVYCLDTENYLRDALKIIQEEKISQFPLISNNGIEGIISDNGITNWLSTKYDAKSISIEFVTLKDIIEQSVDEDFNNYKVISPSTLLFDVVELFSKKLKQGKNSFVLLISHEEKIKNSSDVLGIITPWDIQQIQERIKV